MNHHNKKELFHAQSINPAFKKIYIPTGEMITQEDRIKN